MYYIDWENGCQIAHPNLPLDRNITGGRDMMYFATALTTGSNQDMDDDECGAIYGIFFPSGFLRLFGGPSCNMADVWRILGRETSRAGLVVGTIIKPKLGLMVDGRVSNLAAVDGTSDAAHYAAADDRASAAADYACAAYADCAADCAADFAADCATADDCDAIDDSAHTVTDDAAVDVRASAAIDYVATGEPASSVPDLASVQSDGSYARADRLRRALAQRKRAATSRWAPSVPPMCHLPPTLNHSASTWLHASWRSDAYLPSLRGALTHLS